MDRHEINAGNRRRLLAAFLITGGWMIAEGVGGWWTGSLALMSDAGHMLSDTTALGIALFAASVADRPPDEHHTMGHQRAEVLGAAVNGGGLLGLAVWVFVAAVDRLAAPQPIAGGEMLAVAIVGLLVNLAMAAILARGEGLNQRAALVNVLSDALGSVGAIVAGVLVVWKGWTAADSVASMIIAVLITVGAGAVLRDASDVLMQGARTNADLRALRERIGRLPGVVSVHDFHAWSLRPGEEVVSVHVVLRDGADPIPVCQAVHRLVGEAMPRAHVTVQPERQEH